MKSSHRNIANARAEREKLAAKPPLVSKYAAKVRDQMKSLKVDEKD